jgi:TOMM system kinase/cyclase fusion protein
MEIPTIPGFGELQPIGAGGFGRVYRAVRTVTGRTFAIKVVDVERMDPRHRLARIRRFERELSLCRDLHHPNIVSLVDRGEWEGRPFAVFEYVDGVTLAERLRVHGPLPASEASQLMQQVLDALVCAHSHGVVHRDLKPTNIMVTSSGASTSAKILDFGVGTFLPGVRSEDNTALTGPQELPGTPAYTSPEQLRGDPVTVRSDLYGWGLVFLECLTGQRAITGAAPAAIYHEHLSAQEISLPPALGRHPLGRLLRTALRKDPGQRASSAAQLLEALRRIAVTDLVGSLASRSAELQRNAGAPEARADTWLGSLTPGTRRLVTTLSFSVNVVPLSGAGFDLELLAAFQADQLSACIECCAEFGEKVSAPMGARVLVHSGGQPTSGARRVLLAAWRLLDQITRRSERLERSQGVRLELRAGLDTGMAQVAQDGSLLGLTDLRAGQLEQAAEPGTILVSETARQVLERLGSFTPHSPLQLTGDSRPTAVYQAHEVAPDGSGASLVDAKEAPVVGRDAELALLSGQLRDAEKGLGSALFLRGEPGIGKSRLLREVRRSARSQGLLDYECSCLPEHQNSALRPLLTLIQRELRLLEAPTREAASARLANALARTEVTASLAVPVLCLWLSLPLAEGYAQLSHSPARQKKVLFDSLIQLLSGLARERAMLLVLEDLHWADPTTIEFLRTLVGQLARMPLVLALSARPEFECPFSSGEITIIALERLDAALIAPLMRRVLGDLPATDSVQAAVAQQTDGVPLFVEEYTRMLLDGGELQLVDGHYAFSTRHAAPTIPVRLRELLTERLERSGARRESVQLAAVIGRTFDYELLAAASSMPPEELQLDLDALCQADLVHHAGGGSSGTYGFRHALIRDAAYDSIPSRARHLAHGRVAAALIQRFQKGVSEDPGLVAGHYAAAGDYASAARYGVRATRAAMLRSANDETVAIARQSLAWNQESATTDVVERDRIEYELVSSMFPALLAVAGLGSAELVELGKLTTTLRARLEAAGLDPDALGFAHGGLDAEYVRRWVLFQDHQFRSQFGAAVELAESLLAEARAVGHRRKQLLLLPLLGQTHHFRGDLRQARQCLEEALALYQPEEDGPRWTELGVEAKSQAMFLLGHAAACEGLPEQASALCAGAADWARECGCSMKADGAVYFNAMVAYLTHDRARVQSLTAPYAALSAEAAQTQWLRAFCKQAWEWSVGAVEHSRGLIARQLSLGRNAYVCWPENMVAETEIERGEVGIAIDRLRGALGRVTATGERSCLPLLRRTLARALCAANGALTEEAETLFRSALSEAEAQGAHWLQLDAAVAYAEALRNAGLDREISGLVQPVLEHLCEGHATPLYQRALELIASTKSATSGVEVRPNAEAESGLLHPGRGSADTQH